jgi:hypothetical protein
MGALSALSAPSTTNPERDTALTALKTSQSSTRAAQDENRGGSDDWSNCPPSGQGDDAWPDGANWYWDGHCWWHWSNHQWGKDDQHDNDCKSGGSGSGSGSGSGGGTTTTTTAYDAIAQLNLITGGSATGIFTESKTAPAAYTPTVTQTLTLAGIGLAGSCADPGKTTQSAARMTTQGSVYAMAATAQPSGTPAPTAAPNLAPTVCEIVEYTNGANPVVIDGPAGNDLLNLDLAFGSKPGIVLTAGNAYTFYLVYPVVTTTTTSGGGCTTGSYGGSYSGGNEDNEDNHDSHGDNSYWDGSSWWGWNGSQWCHNQTPAPSPTPRCSSSPGYGGDGGDDHDGGGDHDGGDGGDNGGDGGGWG